MLVDATTSIEVTSVALQTLAGQIGNLLPANRQLSVQLEGEVLRNFASEGAEFGAPWEPLKLSTILARLRKSRGAKAKIAKAKGLYKAGATNSKAIYAASGAGLIKILQDTGALRQAYAGFYDDTEAGVGAVSSAAHADLAIVHQFGDPAHNIPARPMLPPQDLALEWAMVVYQNHVDQARARAQL